MPQATKESIDVKIAVIHFLQVEDGTEPKSLWDEKEMMTRVVVSLINANN